jgi:GNAT superfamily N-acetyltransferase
MADFSGCPDVRLAVPQDLVGLLELMRVACREDAQHEMDEERVINMLRRYYDKQGAIIAVIGEVGFPEAYILMIMDEIWYAKPGTHQLLELSLFVHPDYRKSDRAKQLMQFSKQASEGLAVDLTIGVFSNTRTEAKIRLYQRQYKQVGAYFMYHPSSAEQNV